VVDSDGKVTITHYSPYSRAVLHPPTAIGVSINFIVKSDVKYMQDIEQFYNTQISEMPANVADLI